MHYIKERVQDLGQDSINSIALLWHPFLTWVITNTCMSESRGVNFIASKIIRVFVNNNILTYNTNQLNSKNI